MRGIRVAAAVSCLALLLLLPALLASRSEHGAVLGMWSPALAILIAAVAVSVFLASAVAVGLKDLDSTVVRWMSSLPELAGPLALLALPVTVLLVWFFGISELFSSRSFTAGIFLLSLSPGCLLILSRTGRERKKVLAGGAVMLFSLLMVIAVAEIALRQIMPRQIFNPRFGLRPCTRTELEVSLPGITPGGVLSTNILGFRGENPPENWEEYLTVVTVGGSTTANYYLDDSLTWSHVLQEELRSVSPLIWVGNAGIPRHSSDTHLLFLKEVISEVQPDVVVFLTGVNDMGPFLRGQGGSENRLPDAGARVWMFRNSSILQMLYKAKVVYIDGAPVVTAAVDPEFREEPLTVEEEELPEDLHLLLENPDFYRRRIGLLIEECRIQGIVPVFLTQPLLFEDSEYWRGIQEAARWFQGTERPISAATFALMVEMLNHDLIEVCTEQGVAVFDLASEVPRTRDCFYDAMHMTEVGASITGKEVAGFMVEYLEEEGMLWPED